MFHVEQSRPPLFNNKRIMTAKEYITHGYRLSLQVQQTDIDRAEADAVVCYYLPLLGIYDQTGAEIDALRAELLSAEAWSGEKYYIARAIASVAFLLLLQRSQYATRSGAVTPSSDGATSASGWDVLAQTAKDCAVYVDIMQRYLAEQEGEADKRKAILTAKVRDICGVYFSTNFFYNN